MLPVILEPPIDTAATQGDDGVGAADSLEDAGSLQGRSNDGLAASFNDVEPAKNPFSRNFG
jgi:hypothetical protein